MKPKSDLRVDWSLGEGGAEADQFGIATPPQGDAASDHPSNGWEEEDED